MRLLTKQSIIRWILVALFLLPIILDLKGVIKSFWSFVILGSLSAVIALLIIFKKFYFLSNLIDSNGPYYTDFETTVGKITGYASILMSLVFFLLAYINK